MRGDTYCLILRFMVVSITTAVLVAPLESCKGGFEPCSNVDCSGHGICLDDEEHAICVCDPGYRADGLDCVSDTTDGDGDVDTDVDTDTDSDTDGDVDSDADSDADSDTDSDTDTDSDADSDNDTDDEVCDPSCEGRECGADGCGGSCGLCDVDTLCDGSGRCVEGCEVGAGWGSACTLETPCDDGSLCAGLSGFSNTEGFCAPPCDDDADCVDVAAGVEGCFLSDGTNTWCAITCAANDDCPCGLSCREVEGGGAVCYP